MSGRITTDSVLFDKISGFVRDFIWKERADIPEGFPFESHLFHQLT
jgi:hypothetical protein